MIQPPPIRSDPPSAWIWGIVLLACLLVIGGVAWTTAMPATVNQSEANLQSAANQQSAGNQPAAESIQADQTSAQSRRIERASIFDRVVQPDIARVDARHRDAARRCIHRIEDSFAGYRRGIAPFCEDVNSWGTRFGVLKRMPGDWWSSDTKVAQFVESKFAKHLFTDVVLTRDIESAIKQYRDELESQRNEMLVSIRAGIATEDLPSLPEIEPSLFAESVNQMLLEFAADKTKHSIVSGLLTEIASGVGGIAVEQLLAQAIVRLGLMAGTATATAGGATAGGVAVGGGTGTLGGPVGIAAGIAVGLAVGVVIDWWMSANFEAKMSAELSQVIDELQRGVITGNGNHPGMELSLRACSDQMRDAYRDSLYQRIVQEAK